MKKAGPTECSYVIGHGQLIIKQNAQVVDLACRLYGGVRQDQRLFRDFIQLLTCSQPDDLRLVFVKLETIIGHPVADQSDTVAEASHRIRVNLPDPWFRLDPVGLGSVPNRLQIGPRIAAALY